MGRLRAKSSVVFDESKRREYLLGFRKRKDQRRKFAKDKIERRIQEERKALRDAKRKANGPAPPSIPQDVGDLECTVNQETMDLPTHSVTITRMDDVELAQKDIYLGRNLGTSESVHVLENTDEEPRNKNNHGRSRSAGMPSAGGDPKKLKSLEKMMTRIKGTNRRQRKGNVSETARGGKGKRSK